MHRGYTKRWRKRWDKGYHQDLLLWALMDYFIDHANYKDGQAFISGKKIPVKRGQHVFGRNNLAAFFKVNSSLIYRKLKKLKKMDFLNIESNNRYSIATIINYDTYQGDECTHRTANRTTSRTASEQQANSKPNTPKEYNKEKKEKNKESSGKPGPIFKNFDPKITAKLNDVTAKLTEEKIFKKADAFRFKMLKNNNNAKAVLHCLERCYAKGKTKRFVNSDYAWAYCLKILSEENGNYNEREKIKEAERQQKELREIIDGIGNKV